MDADDGKAGAGGRAKSEGAEGTAEAAAELEALREKVRELTQRNSLLEARLEQASKATGDKVERPSISMLSGDGRGSSRAVAFEEGTAVHATRKRDNKRESHYYAVVGDEDAAAAAADKWPPLPPNPGDAVTARAPTRKRSLGRERWGGSGGAGAVGLQRHADAQAAASCT